MENNQNKVANINKINKCSQSMCKNNKLNLGLSDFTYADFVILSSTLAYAIACELNDEDLDFFLLFLTQVSGDLALLRTKRGYETAAQTGQPIGEEEVLEEAEVTEDVDVYLTAELGRCKKRKKVKRKKLKKKRV